MESPEINPYIFGPLIFDKATKTSIKKGLSFKLMVLGKLNIHILKNELSHKNYAQKLIQN